MSYTPVEITTLTVALAAVIAAFFTGVSQVITAVRTTKKLDENTAMTVQIKRQVEKVDHKIDGVEHKVDGTASEAREQIRSLQDELKWVRERLSDERQDAAILAQAESQRNTAPPGAAVEKSLKQIDENTAAIEKNTKPDRTKPANKDR